MPLTPEQKERLRDDAKFQALIARHPHRQSEFNAAVDQLAEHPDIGSDAECCAAVCNAGSAIGSGIRIFVSYKVGQSEAAEALLKPFRLLGNGRIFNEHPFPFLCERAGLDGMQYKVSIHAALEDTHWFFLLLPDESLDRSWTMFEAGFFRRAMQPGDRLICIHHESVKPAGPLEDFDKVFAKEEEVLDLLHTLLVRPRAMPGMSPISPGLSRDDLRPHAVEIVRKIVPKRDTRRDHYIKFVDLGLEGCSEDYNADASGKRR